MQLGEEPMSWGYGGTGKMSTNCQFRDYGVSFMEGDTITCFLNMDSSPVEVSFAKNGRHLGIAYKIPRDQLKDQALYPHILTKNCEFSVNFGQLPKPDVPLPPGYEDFTMIGCAPMQWLERGSLPPTKKEDCEMLMMCGLPGSGKTTWANKYFAQYPEKKYNILGTNNLIDKMKVMGLPRKRNYAGRWDVLIQKSTKCLNKLMEMGAHVHRNFILDQTNVYPSAQKRKMRAFEGFVRKAVVLVPSDEEFERRVAKRESEEGKDVPDSAVLEMKANFGLPTVGPIFDEVIFVELPREEAEPLVKQYNEEGVAFTGSKKRLSQDQQNNKWGSSPAPSSNRGQWDSNRGGFRDGNRSGGGGRGRGSFRGRDASPAAGDKGGYNRSDQYGSPLGSSPQSGNDSYGRGSSQYQSPPYGRNSPSQHMPSRDHSPYQFQSNRGGDTNRGSRDSYSDQPYNQFQQQDQWKSGGRGGYQESNQSRYQDSGQSRYQDGGQSKYQDGGQSRYQDGGQSRYQDGSQSRYNQQSYDQPRNNQRDPLDYGQQKLDQSRYGQQNLDQSRDQPRYGQQAPDRPRDTTDYSKDQSYDQGGYNRNQQGYDQGGYNRGYDQSRNPAGGQQQYSQSGYGQNNQQSSYGQSYNQYSQGGYDQQQPPPPPPPPQPQLGYQQQPQVGYQQPVQNQGYGGYSQYK